ncbi:MAG: hypothetical protein ACLPRE_07530 [Limisphaerales bacterium]
MAARKITSQNRNTLCAAAPGKAEAPASVPVYDGPGSGVVHDVALELSLASGSAPLISVPAELDHHKFLRIVQPEAGLLNFPRNSRHMGHSPRHHDVVRLRQKQLHFLRHLLFKSFLLKQTEETKICREMRESHKYSALIVNRIPDRFSKRAG